MHAYALEALVDHIKEGSRVLDVGSGTGYLTACFAILVSLIHYELSNHTELSQQ